MFTNIYKGVTDAKNFRVKNFQGHSFGPQNFSCLPFFTKENRRLNPTENHIDSIYRGRPIINKIYFRALVFRPPQF